MSHDERVMNDRIHTRIDPELKSKAEGILSELGISSSEAIRLFYSQICHHRGIPFDVKIPNETTLAALQEDLSNAKRYASFADIRKDLDI